MQLWIQEYHCTNISSRLVSGWTREAIPESGGGWDGGWVAQLVWGRVKEVVWGSNLREGEKLI